MKTIQNKKVKARKPHVCGFCGCPIEKGELYERDACVSDGEAYTFRSHVRCKDLCTEIWDYVDPDDGISDDEFCDAVRELMSTFYCPFHCDEYEKDIEDCEREFDADVCVKRFAEFMETRKLVLDLEESGLVWKIVKTGEVEVVKKEDMGGRK